MQHKNLDSFQPKNIDDGRKLLPPSRLEMDCKQSEPVATTNDNYPFKK